MRDHTLIIAEAGVNHNGSIELAKKLVEKAKEAGVDYIKFQTFKASKLVTKAAKQAEYQQRNTGGQTNSQYQMLKKLELSPGEHEVLIDAIREENPSLKECDAFDIICHVAFDQKPLTRKERIEGVQKRNYLAKYEGQARKVIEGLMEKYGEVGVTNIETPQILNLNPFSQIGKRARIMKGVFKSPDEYNEAVKDLENELYNVG